MPGEYEGGNNADITGTMMFVSPPQASFPLWISKVLSDPLLKGITEKQRVIIKDDICSL